MRFYDPRTNARVDSIPKKSGVGTKSPNINDCIQNGWVFSVTSITDTISKPFLLTWLQEQAFEAAWTCRETPMPKEEAWAWYQQQSAIARDKGSDLHDKIARLEETPLTKPTLDWLHAQGYGHFEHEEQFANSLYGGTIDFTGEVKLDVVDLIDFKTVTKDRKPYDTELWQIAAYRDHLCKHAKHIVPVRRCINLYISQENWAILNVKEWTPQELQRGYEMFFDIMRVAYRLANYDVINHCKYYEKE
jgi:hypothetical protein